MSATAWLVARELRTRWRGALGLALLVGLVGGMVLAGAAGARRTASVYERFLEETSTRDLSVQIDADDPEVALAQVEQLDAVGRSGRLEIFPVLPTDESLITDVDIAILASPDGRWGTQLDRPLVLRGRLPSPDAAEEVLANELLIERTGLGVGDRISVVTFTPDQLSTLHRSGEFTGFGGPEVDLEIVGVGRQATDLQGAEATAGGVLLGTRALQQDLDGEAGALGGLLSVELGPGATAGDVRREVREIAGRSTPYVVTAAEDEFGAATRDATQVLARALAAFAAVAAVAGAVAVGGTVSRQCAQARTAAPTLEAIGCDRRQVALVVGAVPAAGVAAGTLLAVVAAALASGRFPISVARRVEPDPGAHLDLLVLGFGALAMLLAGAAWTVATARRGQRRTAPIPTRGRGRMVTALPPVARIGVGHAFEGRATAGTVPVRAAVAAVVLGVVGVVGAATVVHSFSTLVAEPSRYGWAWSAEPDFFVEDPDELVEELAGADGVESVAFRHNARVELDEVVIEAVAFEPHHGRIDPPLREGRLPASPEEIAVGQHTADLLGTSVGERLAARSADGSDEVELEVVGIAVIAPVDSTDPASGAVVTVDGMERIRRSDGFTSLLLRYEPGFDASALEAGLMDREVADFSSVYSRPRPSGGLVNLDRAMPVVVALGAFFGALAVAGLAHSLVLGTRRRQRELSTLRALGMRRRQVRGVVLLSGLATATAGLALGLPIGLAAGRIAWRVIIAGQGVLDAPSVPVVALAVAVPAALLLAALASWGPSTRAGRHLSTALRSE